MKAFNKKIKPKHVTKTKYKPYEIRRKGKLLLDMMLELYIILKNKAILQKLDLLFLNL